jgi:hypothetical protein
MTRYFRVSIDKNNAYLADALANNYVGTGWTLGYSVSEGDVVLAATH